MRAIFLLVSAVDESTATIHSRTDRTPAFLAGSGDRTTVFDVDTLYGALLAAARMIATRCVNQASTSFDQITSSSSSLPARSRSDRRSRRPRLPSWFAQLMMLSVSNDPGDTLAAVIYVCVVLATELLTNSTAAVLMFSDRVAAARQLGVSELPFVMAA